MFRERLQQVPLDAVPQRERCDRIQQLCRPRVGVLVEEQPSHQQPTRGVGRGHARHLAAVEGDGDTQRLQVQPPPGLCVRLGQHQAGLGQRADGGVMPALGRRESRQPHADQAVDHGAAVDLGGVRGPSECARGVSQLTVLQEQSCPQQVGEDGPESGWHSVPGLGRFQ